MKDELCGHRPHPQGNKQGLGKYLPAGPTAAALGGFVGKERL